MKLIKILDLTNQLEKSAFLKILDNLSAQVRSEHPEVDNILSQNDDQIKNIDNENINKLFYYLRSYYKSFLKEKLDFDLNQFSILIDILVRDGNSIMSREWLNTVYSYDIENLSKKVKEFQVHFIHGKDDLNNTRKRDYQIYLECVKAAYYNDEKFNREKHISREEKIILNTLSDNLSLSLKEKQIIYYSIIPLEKLDIDNIIAYLRECGVIFFNKRNFNIYVPDEIIIILRELLNIELPNKYFRRILRQLSNSQINKICKLHGIDNKLSREEKINDILKNRVSISHVLLKEIHPENIQKTELKTFLIDLANKLDVSLQKAGATAEERLKLILKYLNDMDNDDNIGMSIEGFDKLLTDIKNTIPELNERIRKEFELQQTEVLNTQIMTDYNIKPLDIIYLLSLEELKLFCEQNNIKLRGNLRKNIISAYKDTENLFLENFELIAKRDINGLQEKGIKIKEAELGIKFEELTKKIFKMLGYNVNERLRQKINTKRDMIDILLDLQDKKVVIIECKTIKDKDYNKYSSVSRQIRSYKKICENNHLEVVQTILIAPDFTEDFIDECEYDYELNLTLITAQGLLRILEGFKQSKLAQFPVALFKKGGKMNPDMVIKALNR